MAGIRLEWAQFGDFDTFDVIRSDTSLAAVADEDLPSPIVTGLTTMYYVDTTVAEGAVYYYKVRVNRDGTSIVGDQIEARAGILWTPENITTAMYFNADNVTKDGSNRVSQWTDLSGNNRHAVQPNDSRKPIAATFTGGQNALSFDGTDDLLWQSNTSYLNGVSGAWIFSVNNLAVKSGYNYIAISFYTGTGGTKIGQDINESKYHLGSRRTRGESYAGLDDSATRSNTQNIVFTQVDYANADGFLYVNGTQTASNTSHGTSGNADSIALMGTTIGAYAGNAAGGSYEGGISGKLGCVVIGTGVLSSSDREKLEGWAAYKYGLQSSLPSGHPYKNTPPLL